MGKLTLSGLKKTLLSQKHSLTDHSTLAPARAVSSVEPTYIQRMDSIQHDVNACTHTQSLRSHTSYFSSNLSRAARPLQQLRLENPPPQSHHHKALITLDVSVSGQTG